MSTCPHWSETCPLRSLPCLDLGQGSFRARAVPTLCPPWPLPEPCALGCGAQQGANFPWKRQCLNLGSPRPFCAATTQPSRALGVVVAGRPKPHREGFPHLGVRGRGRVTAQGACSMPPTKLPIIPDCGVALGLLFPPASGCWTGANFCPLAAGDWEDVLSPFSLHPCLIPCLSSLSWRGP